MDGKWEEAIRGYHAVFRANPHISEAYARAANLSMKLGRKKEAETTLRRYLKADPKSFNHCPELRAIEEPDKFPPDLAQVMRNCREAP